MKYLNILLLTTALNAQASAADIAFVFKNDSNITIPRNSFLQMSASCNEHPHDYDYSADSGVLSAGKDHRDTITSVYPFARRPYGRYWINITCESVKGDFLQGATYADRIVSISPDDELQTVIVRATCSRDQNNKLLPPSNIQIIGPY